MRIVQATSAAPALRAQRAGQAEAGGATRSSKPATAC
jgi:hypothetical protein